MNNIESVLNACLQEVGKKILEREYFTSLFEEKKKFAGWFQVELACSIKEKLNEITPEIVLIEERIDGQRYADVSIKRNDDKNIAIEIKFIVKNNSTTDARKSLLNQMHQNAEKHHSYGVAVMVSGDDDKWFIEETNRIKEYCVKKQWKKKV